MGTAKTEYAYAEKHHQVDINVTPTEVFFAIPNMKPGDWAKRSISVHNDSDQAAVYTMATQLEEGSKKLYRALTLEVKSGENVLYNGSLAQFTNLKPRSLEGKKHEELTYIIYFPEKLGNDYQGLQTKIKFIFYAEGDSSIEEPIMNEDGNMMLPRAGAEYVSTLFIGVIILLVGVLLYRRQLK